MSCSLRFRTGRGGLPVGTSTLRLKLVPGKVHVVEDEAPWSHREARHTGLDRGPGCVGKCPQSLCQPLEEVALGVRVQWLHRFM
jgi:hypothetical protein